MIAELKQLVKAFKSWLYLFGLLWIFLFAFGPREVAIMDVSFTLPYPSLRSFTMIMIEKVKAGVLSDNVSLIVTDPSNALAAHTLFSLLLAFILSLPVFLYRLVTFINPALYEAERKGVLLVLLPTMLLFVLGGLFSYAVLTPAAMKFLYGYAGAIGAGTFITLKDLVLFVTGSALFTGILFLTPVFMVLLSKAGLVENSFWRNNWRYAVMFFLVLTAIITPDGSGVTMALMAAPLTGLYFIGYTLAR